MTPGSIRIKPPPKLLENWHPPVFEPIENCPKGTWYKVLPGDGVEVGAKLPRGIRFVLAWISALIAAAFALFVAFKATKPIENWPVMVLVLAVPAGVAFGFAIYRMGSICLRVKEGMLTMERGAWFFKRRRRIPIQKVERVRLTPRSTTYLYLRDDLSVGKVDTSDGSGFAMALTVQTKDEEIEVASDLDLQRTFYLRYVMVKAIAKAKQASKSEISAASAD